MASKHRASWSADVPLDNKRRQRSVSSKRSRSRGGDSKDEDRFGITVLHPPNGRESGNIVFDLVAIHGLNGHPSKTWTHPDTGVMWLQELLPKPLKEEVRIMTYGYNSDIDNFTSPQTVRNIAEKLLCELMDFRQTQDEIHRPIVFVCHSLGGIVAKQALLLINVSQEQKQIQKATYGMIFLGTPHRGSSLASLANIMINIISACAFGVNIFRTRDLFRALKPGSKILSDLTTDFPSIATTLALVSFYETRCTSIWPGLINVLVVSKASATLSLQNEVEIGQDADHKGMARFASASCRNYRSVFNRIKMFKQKIEARHCGTFDLGGIGAALPSMEGPVSIFELPFPQSPTFHGRDGTLQQIEQCFHREASEDEEQLIFTLYGIGGSGKTQIAIHFAHRHRSRYESAVIYINASSRSVLTAEFDRIHELMKLGDSANKVDSVKRWLSIKQNSKWLLIFDNVDYLEAVNISKYLPATPWGHIIMISRSQAAIVHSKHHSFHVAALPLSEALEMLIDRSGFVPSSEEERSCGREIVALQGGLPLALDQAGAFMRARKRRFSEYLRLYKDRQGEVLSAQPKLKHYDETVLTTWDINFSQVEQESQEAAQVLLLLCFLDPGDILESMLLRGCTRQKRWNEDGELVERLAEEDSVDAELASIIKDEMRFDGAIDKLLSYSLVCRNNDFNEQRSLSISPLVQYCATKRRPRAEQDKCRLQAITMICQAFPRDQYLEDSFGEIGRAQLPHLARLLREYDLLPESEVSSAVKRALASTLISSSRFGEAEWKKDAIRRAKMLLKDDDDPYVCAQLVLRDSAMLRMSGADQRRDSQTTLEAFVASTRHMDDSELQIDARCNAQRGDVIVSFAQNMILDGRVEDAMEHLAVWKPLNAEKPSTMESLVMRSRDNQLGQALREKGNFTEAQEHFEKLLDDSMVDPLYEHTGSRRRIIFNLTSVYCELGSPGKGEDLVRPELAWMSTTSKENVSTGRSLRVSLAECQIASNNFDSAEITLENLRKLIEEINQPDYITKTNYFHTFVGLAKIAHHREDWDKALEYWMKALEIGERCGWKQQYPMSIVRYSIAYVLLLSQRADEGIRNLEAAEYSIKEEGPKYWCTGLSTYWLTHIKERMASLEEQAGIIWRASSQHSRIADPSKT